MKRTLAALFLTLLLCSCGAPREPESVQFFAMDTLMTITCTEEDLDAVHHAMREIARLDALLSRTREESAVSALNRGETVEDAELAALLTRAAKLCKATGGAFDVTVAPVVSAWGFTADEYRVPTQEEITALLTHVGAGGIGSDGEVTTLAEGVSVDLGGIGKGYASDCAARVFKEENVSGALAALGGNIYAHGTKSDGSPWRVAVRDPFDGSAYVGALSLTDAFAVTSGGYERYFESGGKTYHHIIDPSTGYPAESGLASVTVVCGEGLLADALSTALYVMGEAKAIEFYRTFEEPFDMILVTQDGRVVLTEGAAALWDTSVAEHSYQYETINKL